MRNSSSLGMAVLSRTAEHALRALLVLARAGDAPMTVDRIAHACGVPRNYLSKTLNRVAAAGLVRGSRGPAGGFMLAMPPEELTVDRITDVFAPPAEPPRCLLGDRPCSAAAPCAAHMRWTAMLEAAHSPLAKTTLADILGTAAPARADSGQPESQPPALGLAGREQLT